MITITEASDATRVSKSTILRSIKSGRISASRNDAGAFMIDPAELARVFPDASRRDSPTSQDAAPEAADVALARLTAELEGERRLSVGVRVRAAGDGLRLEASGEVLRRERLARSVRRLRMHVKVPPGAQPALKLVSGLLPKRGPGEAPSYTVKGTLAAPVVR